MNGAYVVDASVIVKWFLTEEEAADKAASLYDQFYRGRVTLYAPPLIMYEVPRSLHRAVRQARITSELALQHLSRFLDLGLALLDRPELYAAALHLAERYRCNFYDGCYFALAEVLGVPFLCADEKLQRQLAGRVDYLVTLDRLELPE